jgi:hypothetical protein
MQPVFAAMPGKKMESTSMALRRGLGLLVLGLALTSTAALAQAPSRGRSHIPIPTPQGGADFEKLFEERLREMDVRGKDLEKFRELLSQPKVRDLLRDPAIQKKIEELAKREEIQPRIAEQFKKLGEGMDPDKAPIPLTPEEIEQFTRIFKKVLTDGKLPDMGSIDGSEPKPALPKPEPFDPRIIPGSKWGPLTQPADGDDAARQEETRQRLLEWSKRFESLAARMEESPALQQALRDLSRAALDLRNSGDSTAPPIDQQLADLSRWTRDTGGWLQDSWGSLKKLDLPPMPKVRWPATSMPEVKSLPSMPSVGLPHGFTSVPAPSAAGSRTGLVLVCLVLLSVIGWKVLRLVAARRGQPGGADWQLGPWPMDPGQIATRADLVRTFEYLSLLCCGYEARTWNHLQIASQLGGDAAERRRAAVELAALYEQARYAPENEALTAEKLAAARRDLCFLAGIAAV